MEWVFGVVGSQHFVYLALELELSDVHETLRQLAARALKLRLRIGELELVLLEVNAEDH